MIFSTLLDSFKQPTQASHSTSSEDIGDIVNRNDYLKLVFVSYKLKTS